MKLGLLLLVPLALAFTPRDRVADAPVEADDKKTITFVSKPATVGTRYTSTEETTSSFTVTTKGQTMNVDAVEKEERRTEVLAVKDQVPWKVRARYVSHEKVQKIGGNEKREASPVSGKTYLVERKGDTVVVTSESGKPVSAEEEAKVAKDYKRVGKPDEITRTLTSKPRKIGESLDDVAKALADQFKERGAEPGQDIKVEETKLVLSGTKRIDGFEHAVLDLTVKMRGTAKNANVEMTMAGQVFVRIDEASFGEIAVSGPVSMSGADASIKGTLNVKTKTAP